MNGYFITNGVAQKVTKLADRLHPLTIIRYENGGKNVSTSAYSYTLRAFKAYVHPNTLNNSYK